MEMFFAYLGIGVLSGIIGGLLGIGGGVITVPCLFLVFSYSGFPKEEVMHFAVGTSLACTVINTLSSTYFHNRHKRVNWNIVRRIFLGLSVGSIGAFLIARVIKSSILEILFALFAFFVAYQFTKPSRTIQKERMPSFSILSLMGSLIACISNLLGVGGGIFMVPFLTSCHFDPRKVIGTSSAISFWISLFGTLLFLQKPHSFSCPLSYGYIYLPAFIFAGIGSVISSFFGVKLAQILPISLIRKIFAVYMLGVGISMLFS